MINPNNTVHLYGRLTADSEKIMDGKMLRFSVAVDRAGYDSSNKDNTAGFFNCKIWLTSNDWVAAGFIKSVEQLYEAGRLSKGAPVRIVGQLNHDRFKDKDGNSRSDVTVVVESIESYAKGADSTSQASSNNNAVASGAESASTSYSAAEPF